MYGSSPQPPTKVHESSGPSKQRVSVEGPACQQIGASVSRRYDASPGRPSVGNGRVFFRDAMPGWSRHLKALEPRSAANASWGSGTVTVTARRLWSRSRSAWPLRTVQTVLRGVHQKP